MSNEEEINYLWYWLCNIEGMGRTTIRRLLEEYETPRNIYYEDNDIIMEFLHRNQRVKTTVSQYVTSKNKDSIIYSYEKLSAKGVTFIHMGSEDYPLRLKNIPDPPLCLYYKGRLPNDDKKSIAIIGARNSTNYGRQMARIFGRELSKNNIAVISGLARGIDGMAHRGAIEGGGYTMGVLGCGIDVVYPQENYDLFIEMEKNGGIISESNIGIKPYAALFPQRNRIISGLSDGILVVEAREKSGTFITVDQGLEQGKEVFALPGRLIDDSSKGCNNLIKMGAHFVSDIADVLEVLDEQSFTDCTVNETGNGINNDKISRIFENEHVKNLLAPAEKMVYSVLSVDPKYIDNIIDETMLAPGEVCMYLNKMEMMGIVDEPARNYYAVRL
ncbi:MAG: DNA-processing protein DprA [Lachnospiraceae bacterium]|nr:DNA-processing protein DprA [Lachnospiraceae bacterium]